MILTSNWNFGISELLQTIAACSTLLAVVVSLYLANRARRIKKKVIITNDGRVRIVNVGDSKFTISALGYVINDSLYFDSYQEYIKPLSEERQLPNNATAHCDYYFSNVVLEPGDCVEAKICMHQYGDPLSINSVFLVINYKIYKYKYRFNKLTMAGADNSIKSCKQNDIFSCF